jgi:sterol desaturase/sphingolipid hydroxylase (fatty acid hydroxylase superfamily)
VNFFSHLVREIETPRAERPFGSGWLSGVGALVAAIAGLIFVVCQRYPAYFVAPELDFIRDSVWFRLVTLAVLATAFIWSLTSCFLRADKTLGFTAMAIALLASVIGGSVSDDEISHARVFLGLDYFALNILFTGLLFVPLEKLFPHRAEQQVLRVEWREDLFYFLIGSLMVQALTFLALWPSLFISTHTNWQAFRAMVGGQPLLLQFLEIMFLTDLVEYWVHRTFHRIPALWKFHAVHHSVSAMDWLAGSRMHFFEIVTLRALTAIPMMTFGFEPGALKAYLFFVYLYSTFIHSNIGWNLDWAHALMVTPRFHHWHHGIEQEAIDINFASHFTIWDRLFGTYYLPEKAWPEGYGALTSTPPKGYVAQFLHPFRRAPKKGTQ